MEKKDEDIFEEVKKMFNIEDDKGDDNSIDDDNNDIGISLNNSDLDFIDLTMEMSEIIDEIPENKEVKIEKNIENKIENSNDFSEFIVPKQEDLENMDGYLEDISVTPNDLIENTSEKRKDIEKNEEIKDLNINEGIEDSKIIEKNENPCDLLDDIFYENKNIPDTIIKNNVENSEKNKPLQFIEEHKKDEEEETEEYEKKDIANYNSLETNNGKIVWFTESPSRLFDQFYRIKKNFIDTYITNVRQINYDRFMYELENAKVDVSTEVLDKTVLFLKMDEIQRNIDRVVHIQLKCYDQYFITKRFVELLRGSLARVQYLKPQLKQDGLILEHMGDLELYCKRLETVYEGANQIMKTLERAFDNISRKVTWSLEPRNIDRYPDNDDSRKFLKTEKKEMKSGMNSSDINNFDGIEIGEKINVDKKINNGEVGWDDIGD
ncbi:MAG: hypothetical protein WC942_08540 [Clostridia bacterium]|jgi:hypothetical protein